MKPQSREWKKKEGEKQRDVSFRLDADKVTTFAKQPSHPPRCSSLAALPFPFFLSARWTRNSWNVQLQLGHGVTHPFPIYITIYIWMDRQMSALCAPLFSPTVFSLSTVLPRFLPVAGWEDEERFLFSYGAGSDVSEKLEQIQILGRYQLGSSTREQPIAVNKQSGFANSPEK